MRKQLNVRIPDTTQEQIAALCANGYESQAHVIIIAVHDLYRKRQEETQTMQNPYAADPYNPTHEEADALAKMVYDAAYPDREGERRDDELTEIYEWLLAPGGWADYAEPESLAAEWLQVQAESENL